MTYRILPAKTVHAFYGVLHFYVDVGAEVRFVAVAKEWEQSQPRQQSLIDILVVAPGFQNYH